MLIVFKYYLLQFKHYIHQLRFRIKLEIIILLGIFYSYISEKLIHYFAQLLTEPNITNIGLSSFSQHLLLVLFALTTPFIYFHLLPRQRGFHLLSLQPLSPSAVLGLIIIYYFKYQIILLILVVPVFIALAANTDPLSIVIFSLGILFYPINYLILVHVISSAAINKMKILTTYYLFQILYFGLFVILYLTGSYYILYHIITLLLSAFYLFWRWKNIWRQWDTILRRYLSVNKGWKSLWQRINYSNFPKIVPFKIHPLFVREMLSRLRNRDYMRLKIISLILLVVLLKILDTYFIDNYKPIFILTCLGFIWYHYTHQFNEKYTFAESNSFLKTVPFYFYQICLAKFLSEFIFTLFFLFIIAISLLNHGSTISEIIQVFTILSLFSIFVLATTVVFRILFYDNPRTAGYAYHFAIIFSLTMLVAEFYLVGPIIILFLLFYFSYLSYRQFVK